MKTSFFTLLVATAILFTFPANTQAQTGNDNLTGPAGIFNGDVTTAGDYDPYTANAHRSVADIVVARAVGTQPSAVVRTSNSRGVGQNAFGDGYGFGLPGGWSHNYQWSNPAGGNFLSYLLLTDGSKVEFTTTEVPVGSNPTYYYYTYLASAITDPYGQRTSLTYNSSGLLVKEPAGRTLQFYNKITTWGDKVIDHVTASDGRTVQYHYSNGAMAGATAAYTYLDSVTYYGDGALVAHYTYQKPNIPDGLGT